MTHVRRLTPLMLCCLASIAVALPATAASPRIPVILATDIGDDIDDTWALALVLRSPELDLRLVLTDYGDTVYRARLAAKLLEVAGRADVPIAVGVRERDKPGPQSEWLGDYTLARYPGPVLEDGVQALIDTVMGSGEPMTLISIGPPPTVHAALEREPRIAPRLRLAGMYGSLREGYAPGSKPEPEWNVKAAPSAARALLAAPWRESLVTPLDTCGRVVLDGARFARLRDSRDPLVVALLANYRLWCPRVDFCSKDAGFTETRSTTLFDTVAVYLAFAHDLVKVESLGVRVTDEGMTLPDASARPQGWASAWRDREAFADLLADRLAGRAARR